jgi:hypothetical protein
MTDLKYQCAPCNPFTKLKCAYCVKIKLRAVEHARTIKALADVQDGAIRNDVVSVYPELELAAAEQLAA